MRADNRQAPEMARRRGRPFSDLLLHQAVRTEQDAWSGMAVAAFSKCHHTGHRLKLSMMLFV
jgi:hypothetical protein